MYKRQHSHHLKFFYPFYLDTPHLLLKMKHIRLPDLMAHPSQNPLFCPKQLMIFIFCRKNCSHFRIAKRPHSLLLDTEVLWLSPVWRLPSQVSVSEQTGRSICQLPHYLGSLDKTESNALCLSLIHI